jgi:23S rRNA (guanosine2251-2'-O)-methyltransferase
VRLVLGIQPVREAIRAHGSRVVEVVVKQGDYPQLEALARFARDQGIPVKLASPAELDRRAKGVRHQGVLAFAPDLRLTSLADLAVGPGALFLALDGIQDPQNFGAVVRSAVAFGASGLVWAEHSAAPLSPATFRASAGAIEHAVLCRVASLPAAVEQLAGRGAAAIGLDDGAECDLAAVDLSGPTVLVVGSEDKGLRRAVRQACSRVARLPTTGPVAALNASAAAAAALYEVRRQRARQDRRG